ncbi:MAG: replication-associated recombination protein A, partial [Alphaproteobacteria bacterium]|nr:replication-associated recombination protein A [Alphaproteobacteria bacterium]
KSISAYKAQSASYAVAKRTSNLMPPKNILNAPTKMMKNLGYGKDYIYDPETESGCSGQNCFPESMDRQSFYHPIERGFEREIKKRLEYWDAMRRRAKQDD